ncbi:MAG: hypothetical protein AB7S26_24170 [Sandaracinaceae bacterium]
MASSLPRLDGPEGEDELALQRSGATPLGRLVTRSSVWRLGERFFVIMHDGFSGEDLAMGMREVYAHADPPEEIAFVEAEDIHRFDRSILTYYERDRRTMPGKVSVVARRPLTRVVVRATSLGFRAITGVSLALYDSLPV